MTLLVRLEKVKALSKKSKEETVVVFPGHHYFFFRVILSWFMFIQLLHTLLGISTWDFVDVPLEMKDNFIVCLLSFTCSARYCCWALCVL